MKPAEEAESLAHQIAAILSEKRRDDYCPLDPERRALDHEWVLMRREKERARTEFYRALTLHLAKWGAVSVLSVLVYALWLGLKTEALK